MTRKLIYLYAILLLDMVIAVTTSFYWYDPNFIFQAGEFWDDFKLIIRSFCIISWVIAVFCFLLAIAFDEEIKLKKQNITNR